MKYYQVHGIVPETGESCCLEVYAVSEVDARTRAGESGLQVTQVEPAKDKWRGAPGESPTPFIVPIVFIWIAAFVIGTICLFGWLPGAAVGAVLSWLGIVNAPPGLAAGAGAAIGTVLAILGLVLMWVRDAHKKP